MCVYTYLYIRHIQMYMYKIMTFVITQIIKRIFACFRNLALADRFIFNLTLLLVMKKLKSTKGTC